MAIVNNKQVTLDADIIENMSANDISYDTSTQYDENTVGDKLSELNQQVIYDVTVNNNGATFESLQSLLNSSNISTLIPIAVRCGGMSIRFVQSFDNKYVQYFLTKNEWSVDQNDWEKLNLEEEIEDVEEKLTKTEENVLRLSGGEQFLFLSMSPGYIYNGSSHSSNTYKYSTQFLVKAGDTLVVSSAGYNYSVISRYDSGNYIQLVAGNSTNSELKTYSYTPTEDSLLVVCCKIDPAYSIKVVYHRTTATVEEMTEESARIDLLEEKVLDYESELSPLVQKVNDLDLRLNGGADEHFTRGGYVNSNNSVVPSDVYCYSDYIPITAGLLYTINYGSISDVLYAVFCDDDLNIISAYSFDTSSSRSITAPTNSTCVRFSFNPDNVATLVQGGVTIWQSSVEVEGVTEKIKDVEGDVAEILNLTGGETTLRPSMTLGHIYNGSVHSNQTYEYSTPFIVKAGNTIKVKSAGYNYSVISKFNSETGVYTQLVVGNSTISELKEYEYTFTEDTNVVVCCKIDPIYTIKLIMARRVVTKDEITSIGESIQSIKSKVEEYDTTKITDIGYSLHRIMDAYGRETSSDTAAIADFKANDMSDTRLTLLYDGQLGEDTIFKYRLYIYDENKTFISRSGLDINFGSYVMVAKYAYIRFNIYKMVSDGFVEVTEDDIAHIRINGYTTNTMYPYDGERISIRPVLKWKMLARATYGNYLQDGDQYNGLLFQFYDQRNEASELKGLEIIDLNSGEITQQIELGQVEEHHINAVCFSSVKWDDVDEFPLLYASGLFDRKTFVYRITGTLGNYALTKVQTISVDDLNRNFTSFVDKERGLFVAMNTLDYVSYYTIFQPSESS